jgi:uncharacterized protein YodC (DUF2158 family)
VIRFAVPEPMMTPLKLGDLVVLKSGGPVMTVDAINTDIFDDSKYTGVVCVWFVGDTLQRVRFDYRTVEPASLPAAKPAAPVEQVGDYKDVLDSMMAEMNDAAAAEAHPPVRAGRARVSKGRAAKAERTSAIEPSVTIGRH